MDNIIGITFRLTLGSNSETELVNRMGIYILYLINMENINNLECRYSATMNVLKFCVKMCCPIILWKFNFMS